VWLHLCWGKWLSRLSINESLWRREYFAMLIPHSAKVIEIAMLHVFLDAKSCLLQWDQPPTATQRKVPFAMNAP